MGKEEQEEGKEGKLALACKMKSIVLRRKKKTKLIIISMLREIIKLTL